jgi:hypothetical protein
LNQHLDFHEIRQGSHATEGDLDVNHMASTIFKMADVQTSEVDEKPAPVSLGLSRIKFGNHGKKTIVM